VQARMERVGGSVQIWSSPGSGTSVVIRVAVDGAPGSPTASSTEGGEHGPGSVRVEGIA
jgi:hypothetical protein